MILFLFVGVAFIIGALSSGAAVYFIQEGKIKLMKKDGLDALRTAHNETKEAYKNGYKDGVVDEMFFRKGFETERRERITPVVE